MDSWLSCISPLSLPEAAWDGHYLFHCSVLRWLCFWVEIVTLDLCHKDPKGKPQRLERGLAPWQFCDFAAPQILSAEIFLFYLRQENVWSDSLHARNNFLKFLPHEAQPQQLRAGTPGAEAASRAPSPPAPPSLMITLLLLNIPAPLSPFSLTRSTQDTATSLSPSPRWGRRWRPLRAGLRGGGHGARPAALSALRGRRPRGSLSPARAVPALPRSPPRLSPPRFSPREDGVPLFVPVAAAEVAGWGVSGRRRGEAEGALWRWVRGAGRGASPHVPAPLGKARRGILNFLVSTNFLFRFRLTQGTMPPRGPGRGKLPVPLPKDMILKDTEGKTWRLGSQIGQGGFGLIYLGKMLLIIKRVACKLLCSFLSWKRR